MQFYDTCECEIILEIKTYVHGHLFFLNCRYHMLRIIIVIHRDIMEIVALLWDFFL